jgi:hypothetical protein
MRPIPDDVQAVPEQAKRPSSLADAGAVALADAGLRPGELPHSDHLAACMDSRHHVLRVQQIATDRWIIGRGVLALLRSENKAQVSPQIDAATGHVTGLAIEDIGEASCLGALGFRTGDVLRTVNGHEIDWAAYTLIYQSIMKDGTGVVRFERGGHALTVLYEVRDD